MKKKLQLNTETLRVLTTSAVTAQFGTAGTCAFSMCTGCTTAECPQTH